MEALSFQAEIKQVSTKKLASLDMEHRVVFASNDPAIASLALVDGDTMVKVTVELV